MASSFPVALHLVGKPCLVVGVGREAGERAEALLLAGALVRLVSPTPDTELSAYLGARALRVERRAFVAEDLDGCWLAVLTDRDHELGQRMASAAHERRVLFCATDQAQDNSYSHMALARAGLVTVAIGTEGRAPALGRRLREELSRLFTLAKLEAFADSLAALRERTAPELRRDVLGRAVAGLHISGRLELPEPRDHD
jgi:siroheme synthase-like protein